MLKDGIRRKLRRRSEAKDSIREVITRERMEGEVDVI
jgi:hypothetical protein